MTTDTERAAEATDLLQHLIRNSCVNDGTPESGQEERSADILQNYLEGSGVELETYEPAPGRTSLVAKLAGTDSNAPSLTLLGHTDVVPANPDDWTHDPFGGELIDGEVWGRGAIDMLNLTTTMATGIRHLALSGFRPKGDLTYIAVADEEALSTYGARWLCANAADDIRTDYVITESGGFPMYGVDGLPRLPVIVGEKGVFWCILTVTGTPGHASQPLRTDNALVKAAEVVKRIDEYRPQAELHEAWTRFIAGLGFPPELSEPLLDPERIDDFCDELPLLGLAGGTWLHGHGWPRSAAVALLGAALIAEGLVFGASRWSHPDQIATDPGAVVLALEAILGLALPALLLRKGERAAGYLTLVMAAVVAVAAIGPLTTVLRNIADTF